MSGEIGFRACGKHGYVYAGVSQRIDINCSRCIVWPERRTDGQYVGDLRVFYGLDRYPAQVEAGEQLTMEVAS